MSEDDAPWLDCGAFMVGPSVGAIWRTKVPLVAAVPPLAYHAIHTSSPSRTIAM